MMNMVNKTADEYVGKFKILAHRAGVTENATLRNYFIEGLPDVLKKWLIDTRYPDSVEELYKKVQE